MTCAHQVDHESLVLGSNLGLAKLFFWVKLTGSSGTGGR